MTSPLPDPCWDNLAATWGTAERSLPHSGVAWRFAGMSHPLMQVESQGRSDLDNDQLIFGCQILSGTLVLHLGG